MSFRIASVLLLVSIAISSCHKTQNVPRVSTNVVRVCFTGDVMLSRGVKSRIVKSGKEFLFEKINPVLAAFNYRFINLECPITHLAHPPDKPYSFRADSNYVSILVAAGITHATLANNHIDDQTIAGADETRRILIENGIGSIGLKSKNDTVCTPAEVNVGTRTLAVFAGLGIEMNCSNIWYVSDSLFVKSIRNYRTKNPSSFIVCYVHWGIEYRSVPSDDQVESAKAMIDAGADVVIGHHPHVMESIDYYKGKPILYSLGNMIFDQHDPDTKEGMIAGLTFIDSTVDLQVTPYDIVNFRPVPVSTDKMESFRATVLSFSPNISLIDSGTSWEVKPKSTLVASK